MLAVFRQQSPLSVPEVAYALGVTPQTVRRRIYDGTIPARRVGRLYKIDPRDLGLIAPHVDVSEDTA